MNTAMIIGLYSAVLVMCSPDGKVCLNEVMDYDLPMSDCITFIKITLASPNIKIECHYQGEGNRG